MVSLPLALGCAHSAASVETSGDAGSDARDAISVADANTPDAADSASSDPLLTCASAASLETACCRDSNFVAPCPANWASAEVCAYGSSSGGAGGQVVSATPCHGLVAMYVQATDIGALYVYDAASGALEATFSQFNGSLACLGAASTSFALPSDCYAGWIGENESTAATRCASFVDAGTGDYCAVADAATR